MANIAPTRPPTRPAATSAVVAACAAAYCIANIPGWVLPQYIFGLMQRYQLTATAASLVPMIELLLIGVVAISLGARPLQRSPRTLVVVGTAITAAANAAATALPDVPSLLGVRATAGVAEAVVLYYSTALLATTPHPDRAYAIQNIANNVFGALLLLALAPLAAGSSGLVYLAYSAAPVLLLLPLLWWLPGRTATSSPAPASANVTLAPPAADRPAAYLLVATIALVAVNTYAHFAFAIPLGMRVGLSENAVNVTLGAGGMLSIAGAVAAIFVTRRHGRLRPLLFALGLMLLASLLMVRSPAPALFRAAVAVNMALMYFMPPLLLGYAAAADPSGRSAGIVMGASVVACAAAPLVGGVITDALGLDAFIGLAVASAGLAAVLLRLADRRVVRLVERAARREG